MNEAGRRISRSRLLGCLAIARLALASLSGSSDARWARVGREPPVRGRKSRGALRRRSLPGMTSRGHRQRRSARLSLSVKIER